MESSNQGSRKFSFWSTARHWLSLGLVVLVFPAVAEQLTVVSWGGSYAKACNDGYIDPFAKSTGIKVHIADYNGGLAQVRAQVDSGNVRWDVIDVETQDLIIGCDQGLFVPLEGLDLPDGPDGSEPSVDFFPGAVTECGVATLVGAGVIAYNADMYPTDPPTTIQDFFNVEKYPGKRGLRRSPLVNLEWALIADGVPIEEVYEVLGTKAGYQRAFAKLDTIKDSIVFWEAGAQPPQLLADKEVVMTSAYNGRIFNAQIVEQQPFVIIWDAHSRDYGHWAIISGAPNADLAKQFIQYAARSQSMAAVANRISYAPVRESAWKYVGEHVDLKVNMRLHMPTHPDHSNRYFTINSVWWSEHKDELTERFSSWISR